MSPSWMRRIASMLAWASSLVRAVAVVHALRREIADLHGPPAGLGHDGEAALRTYPRAVGGLGVTPWRRGPGRTAGGTDRLRDGLKKQGTRRLRCGSGWVPTSY